jgi:hypothetical protein
MAAMPMPLSGRDGVAREVEGHVRVLLGDHVEVRLEDDDRRPLLAGRGGLLDYEIAH